MSEVRLRKIGLYCNRNKPQVMALARSIYSRLEELGAEPMISREIEARVGIAGKVDSKSELCAQSQALVVLGGDGTLLWAARESYPYDIPILGVNLGYLGFLSETSTDNLEEQLALLVQGRFFSSSRMTLWVKVLRGPGEEAIFESPVIIDVHVFRQFKSRIVKLETYIDGELVTHYRADGILVSTPTGSTGHSLSAGGPILKPEMRAILITPVCPHTLASRSIVAHEDDVVEVRIQAGDADVCLSVDGQVEQTVAGGDRIVVKRGRRCVQFVQPGKIGFYQILRRKLYLGETSAESQNETSMDRFSL